MIPSLYRLGAAVMFASAIGHALLYRQLANDSDVQEMKRRKHRIQGFDRTLYDYYQGFANLVTLFFAFDGVATWFVADLPPELGAAKSLAWLLCLLQWARTVLVCHHFGWGVIAVSSVNCVLVTIAVIF